MSGIVVVTKVPDRDEQMWGNLAVAGFDLRWATGERDENHLDKTIPFIDALVEMFGSKGQAASFLLNMRQEVFALGEILFLDANGRELIGPQRKPDKWLVEVTDVDTIEEAIALSKRVTREADEAARAAQQAEEAKHD